MELPPTSDKLRFIDSEHKPIEAPSEWSSARIEVAIPTDAWKQVRLSLQGLPLEVSLRMTEIDGEDRPHIMADLPRLGPGRYRLQLTVDDEPTDTREIIVRPSKLSQEAFERLIDDLETRLPASIAIGLQRLGALAGVNLLPPGETTRSQELARLRRAVEGTDVRPGLASVLSMIGRDPYCMLRQMEPWVRHAHARRPVPSRLVAAVARTHNIKADRKPHQVVDARVESTADVYENRLVKLYVSQVMRRLLRLARTHAPEADAIATRARELLDQLRRARMQADFLDEVTLSTHLPQRVSMVLLKRPPYRATLEGYLEFHRSPIVRMEEPALEAPLENLPWLYQVWGTLELFDVLLAVAGQFGYHVVSYCLIERDSGGFFVRLVPNGRPAIELIHEESGTRIHAIPERTYGRYGGLHSISFDQRPDIAVEVTRQDGSKEIYLFDPKYKLDSEIADGQTRSWPVKTDIDKMHTYRDAIRDAFGGLVVRYAAILYPGDPIQYPVISRALPLVEGLRAYPGDDSTLRGRLAEVFGVALAVVPSV